jgi:hypothetical protein
MPIKYLELDSTYRNRNLSENEGPGSFICQISQTASNQTTALDPITYAYPDIVFTYAQTELVVAGTAGLSYTLPATNFGFSSETKFLLTSQIVGGGGAVVPVDLPYAVNGFFVGAVLNIPIAAISTVQTPPVSPLNFRITEWIKLSNTQFLVSTELPVPLATAVANGGISIFQPSTGITAPGEKYIYIPSSLSIPNYYTGSYIYNQTNNEACLITSYDKDTHLAQITIINGWADTDVLIVRKQLPKIYSGDTRPYTQYATIPSATLAINAVAPNKVVDLSINNGGANIALNTSFINSFLRFFANDTATAYTVNKIIGIVLAVTPIGGVVTTYVIDYNGSAYYQYNNSSTTAQYTSTAVLDTSIVALPAAPGSMCEIMSFNTDNYSPFSYSGSMSSQTQPVSYDLTLNSLVLPNVVLSKGARIAYYPFIYVELDNISTSSANKNAIYSNNPNASKAIFKVPITDLNHPSTTPFVKLTGNGMTQTLIFKSNTDMKITVRLPDGSIFKPETSENPVGKTPNPMIQLSALFGMTRI